MTDLATLGLEIRSDGVVVASDRLKRFGEDARRTETATSSLARTVGLLKTMLGGLVAAFGIRELIQLTSTWTDLNSRVNNAAGSIERGTAVMGRLTEMSRRTYSSLNQTAESWLANAASLKAMGYSTEQQLDLTEALNNSLVISATRGDRAASVMNAWSKAMASGKLSGDNLNTIIESGGRLAQALADSMGVSVLQLRSLGASGKITAKDMFGVTKELERLREEADAMPATIQDAFVLMGNAVLTAVGSFDQMSGASSRVAEAIIWVADAINSGTISIERLIALATAAGLYMAGTWVASFIAANGAVGALTIGLTALRGALMRTGVGALIVLAGELIYQLHKVVEGSDGVGDAMKRLGRSGVQTWERIVSAAKWFEESMNQISDSVVAYMAKKWGDLIQFIIVSINRLQRASGIEIFNRDAMSGIAEANLQAWERADAFAASAAEHGKTAAGHFAAIFEDKSGGSGAASDKAGGGVDLGSDGSSGGSFPAAGSGGKKRNPYADLIRGAKEFIAQQELEARVLGMTEEAANRLRYEQEMLNKAANDNIKLTPQQREQIGSLAAEMARTEETVRSLTEMYNTGKEAFTGFFADMKNGLKEGQSFWDALGNAGANALDKITSKALDMATNGIFDMIFGSLKGVFGGGAASGWGVAGGFGKPGIFGIPSFDGGGSTGTGARMGGLDGKGGFAALLHPNETVIDHTRGAANGNGGGLTVVRIEMSGDVEGRILQQSGQQSVQIVRAAAPSIAEQGATKAGQKLAGGDFNRGMASYGLKQQAKRR